MLIGEVDGNDDGKVAVPATVEGREVGREVGRSGRVGGVPTTGREGRDVGHEVGWEDWEVEDACSGAVAEGAEGAEDGWLVGRAESPPEEGGCGLSVDDTEVG